MGTAIHLLFDIVVLVVCVLLIIAVVRAIMSHL